MYKPNNTGQTTVIAAVDTLTDLTVTTTAGNLQDFTMPSNGVLQYNGSRDILVYIRSMLVGIRESGGGANNYIFTNLKDGSEINANRQTFAGNSGDASVYYMDSEATLSTGDQINGAVENASDGDDWFMYSFLTQITTTRLL